MATPDVPERWVALAADAIDGEEATATYGYEGASWRIDGDHAPDLAREALAPVLADLRRQVLDLAFADVPDLSGPFVLLGDVLDLIDTGGSE